MQENNRTEFKSELNDRFERSVVSLSLSKPCMKAG